MCTSAAEMHQLSDTDLFADNVGSPEGPQKHLDVFLLDFAQFFSFTMAKIAKSLEK